MIADDGVEFNSKVLIDPGEACTTRAPIPFQMKLKLPAAQPEAQRGGTG